MRRKIFALPAGLIAASLLGGCGFLHRQFDRTDDSYKLSTEHRPLEVPPDLDTPSGSNALVIPAAVAAPASGTAPAAMAANSGGTPPAIPASSVGTPPAIASPPVVAGAAGVAVSGDALIVQDTVASSWTRVGLAMERSGAATILQRDQATASYRVETTGQTTQKPGWFKRAITFGLAGNKVTAKVQLVVRVAADGAGSRVSIEGASDEGARDAARALLQVLRERLT